ncbi:TetR/AcrR family transcriptional regulator [Anaerohalosphaera lusitana]|uniref:TetR/AcrR family transcriptional regulator n=1 Tax=Anaerohalosphaera lusitana TaxID=1936003 RepID=UPI001474497B|nr:TetR/AcrR family transcriptional regulator [Anaerohalosphaera lusitana]
MARKPEIIDQSNDDTRCRILEIARQHFAEKGFRASSVRAITEEADCNVASVNYYFGSKQNLYVEAFRSVIGNLTEVRVAALEGLLKREHGFTLEELLRTFCRVFIDPLLENGGGRMFMRLMQRELDEKRLPPGLCIDEGMRPVRDAAHEALKRVFPQISTDVSYFCIQSVVGQLVYALQMKTFLSETGYTDWPALDLERTIDHVVHFSAAGIRGCVENTKGSAND